MKKPSKIVVSKVATAVDEATGQWFEVFEFITERGKRVEVDVKRSIVRKRQKLIEHLVDQGAPLPRSNAVATQIVEAAIGQNPRIQRTFAAHSGWRPDFSGFVHSRPLTIRPNEEICAPRSRKNVPAITVKDSGPLTAWKKHVALPAAASSRMVTGIAAAFAAPLLRIVDLQSFALFFYGPAKLGKTTILVAAGSVIGIASESDLPAWNITDPAFDQLAHLFNDLLFPINEIAIVGASKKSSYDRLWHFTYRFSEGKTLRRHSSFQSGPNGEIEPMTWRSLMITCSEHSMAEWAAMAGNKRDAGETVRFVDVPVQHGKCSTIFDWFEERHGTRQAARSAGPLLGELRRACSHYAGAPFAAFVSFLSDRFPHLDSFRERVIELMAEFERKAVRDEMQGHTRHAAKNFALVYAGGVLGIEAGILPWSKKLLRESILRCFEDGLEGLPDPDQQLRDGLERLRDYLTSNKIVKLKSGARSNISLERFGGFRHRTSRGTEYVIRAEALKTVLEDPTVRHSVLHSMASEGLLDHSKAMPSSTRGGLEWAQRQVGWPDGTRKRSLIFIDQGSDGFVDLTSPDPSRRLTSRDGVEPST